MGDLGEMADGRLPDASDGRVLNGATYRSPKIIALFLGQIPDEFARLEAAIRSGDGVTVRQIAHKLKGSCRAIGVPRMAALCEVLDQPLTNVDEAMTQYRLLVIEHERARILLEREQLGSS